MARCHIGSTLLEWIARTSSLESRGPQGLSFAFDSTGCEQMTSKCLTENIPTMTIGLFILAFDWDPALNQVKRSG
jgi:hypothetical protein